MKIIVAPDKFKGSLTSLQVCLAVRAGILEFDQNNEVAIFPMADGGDGFAEVMKYYIGTESQAVASVDPLRRNIVSSYEWTETGQVAIIELAAASGLAMLNKEERNPLITSTYGTGLQMKNAIEKGAKKIILGVGGSATNDAGMGILTALGFQFCDAAGQILLPSGENLRRIEKIIPPSSIPSVLLQIACDVDNPLYGPEGAAYIFSPQKGAGPEEVKILDEGLRQFARVVKKETGKDVATFPGAGAAGGIAAGLTAYFNVNLVEGTSLIIEASKIKSSLDDADIIFTGEGKLDQQSLRGKTIQAIASLASERKIPTVALCGKVELQPFERQQLGLIMAEEINDGTYTEEESIEKASMLLQEKSRSLMPLLIRR